MFLDVFPFSTLLTEIYVGNVTVTASLQNMVSKIELIYQFYLVEIIEAIIVDASSLENPNFVKKSANNDLSITLPTNSKVVFLLSVLRGSSVTYLVKFGNNVEKTAETSMLLASQEEVKVLHSYPSAGKYDITIIAYNSISSSNITIGNILVYERISSTGLQLQYIDDAEFSVSKSNLSLVHYSQIYSGFKYGYADKKISVILRYYIAMHLGVHYIFQQEKL